MTTLNQLYSKNKDLGIAVNKTFMVPVQEIYEETGFNVRETNQEHIDSIAEAYESGEYLPPIVVEITSQGIKIIDGHHRYHAAKKANVSRLECKQFTGDESDKIAMMIKSSQGRQLTPFERAKAYSRLENQGLTRQEISKRVGRSRGDVDNHLLLLTSSGDVIESVKSGDIGFSSAVNEIRKSGPEASEKIMSAVKKAKESGKKVQTSFSRAKYKRVMEILSCSTHLFEDSELHALVSEWESMQ